MSPNIAEGRIVPEDEVEEAERGRMVLRCDTCTGSLVLYRFDAERYYPRGRETDLETFLKEHAECVRPPSLTTAITKHR